MYIDLVCLANSRKYNANCIAGREWSASEHAWIRPVAATEHGEILADTCMLQGLWPQRQVRPFDIVRLELQGLPSPQEHPEDRLLGSARWTSIGTLHPSDLRKLVDPPDVPIPVEPSPNATDHLTRSYLLSHPLTRSLWLIEVPSLKLVSKAKDVGLKWYAEFTYQGVDYRLRVTDDYFLQRLEKQGRLREGLRPEKHICISIGVHYEAMDAYYKLVAAVLP